MSRALIKLWNFMYRYSETFRVLVDEAACNSDEYVHVDNAAEMVRDNYDPYP